MQQHLPSQCFAQYASPLPPSSGLGVGAGYTPHARPVGQAPWGTPQTMRYASTEGVAANFRPELVSGAGGHVSAHRPQMGYQASSPYGPTHMVGTPVSYHQASPIGQGPFSFLPGVQQGSQMPYAQPQPFQPISEAPAPQGVIRPSHPATGASASTGPPPGASPAQSPPAAPAAAAAAATAAAAAAPQAQDRAAYRELLCKQSFEFVDALRTSYIDISQNKTALMMVFERLGDVPMPKDEWYVRVFKNFVREDQDLVDYQGFKEIVVQWDEHHLRKRQAQPRKAGEVFPPPPPRGDSVHSMASGARSGISVASAASMTSAASSVGASQEVTPTSAASAESVSEVAEEHAVIAPTRSAHPSGEVPTAAAGSSDVPKHQIQYENPSTPQSATPQIQHSDSALSRGTKYSAAAELKSEIMFPTYVGRLAIFDDYEFFGDVGAGSFGKVMVVRHRNTKQLRACKVVTVQSTLQRELIDTEIKLLKSLNHPNIMKMHEVYFEQERNQGRVTNGNIYLVTELCEGGDLFSRILHHYNTLKQPMTESHVAFMMQQILSATKYCHDQGIIHRDIKPENILFVDRSSSSPLKIIDFGLANFTEKIREQAREVKIPRGGTMGKLARMLPSFNGKHLIPFHERKKVMQKAGTPHYMAPEMIEGHYDEKADIFSIGIILCQLFTGWHPFYVPGDDEHSVREKILAPEPVHFPPDVWASVSVEARDLCQKLVEKCPRSRPSAAQCLAHPWFNDPDKPSPFGNAEVLSMSIFDGLMQYQAYNKLKRAVLQLLTRELSEFQIQELRNKFMALDRRGDGLLSAEELIAGMRHVGYEMSGDELAQVMAALDGSGNQRIGYKEFISALIERRVKFDRQQLWECFKKLDTNNTGVISYEGIKTIMTPAITESEWQEIANFGGKGSPSHMPDLTFDQFVALMEQTED